MSRMGLGLGRDRLDSVGGEVVIPPSESAIAVVCTDDCAQGGKAVPIAAGSYFLSITPAPGLNLQIHQYAIEMWFWNVEPYPDLGDAKSAGDMILLNRFSQVGIAPYSIAFASDGWLFFAGRFSNQYDGLCSSASLIGSNLSITLLSR